VSVEVLAGRVVAHGRAWVGVSGGGLDLGKADSGVEHGDERVPQQHVGVHPWSVSRPAGPTTASGLPRCGQSAAHLLVQMYSTVGAASLFEVFPGGGLDGVVVSVRNGVPHRSLTV
jgi:hypothetical protein